jgi:hypothetical protein
MNLVRDRNVWGVVLGRALTDPIWWFYVFWLPEYLSDARGFSLKRIALFAWMRNPRSHMGVRFQLSADPGRDTSGERPQCLHGIGVDLFRALGLCELVHNGTDSAL